jgi:hypothetical protein
VGLEEGPPGTKPKGYQRIQSSTQQLGEKNLQCNQVQRLWKQHLPQALHLEPTARVSSGREHRGGDDPVLE